MVSEARVISFPHFAFVGSECSNSRPGRFTPRERAPVCIRGKGLMENRSELLGGVGNVLVEAGPSGLSTIFLATMRVLVWQLHHPFFLNNMCEPGATQLSR